jgi:hypothetical protein
LNVINATVLVTKLNFVGWTQINTVKSIIGNIMITLRIGTRKTAKKSKPIVCTLNVPVFEIFWMKNGEKIKKRQFRFFLSEYVKFI